MGGAIGLSFALPYVASWIFGDAEGWSYVGILIAMPAFLLLLPVLILAVIVDYAGRRTYPAKPIVATWDVRLDGAVHVVSLPESQTGPDDSAWVDGERMLLTWTPTGECTARAGLDGGTFSGTLSMGYAARELAANMVFAAFGGYSRPRPRYALQVEGATVETIPVANGERRS